jgi:glycosyltransferase involved in cell wall biosynthesis
MTTLLANSKERSERYEIALAVLDDEPAAFPVPGWLRLIQLDCKRGMVASIAGLKTVVRGYDPDVTLSFLTRANFANVIAMARRQGASLISERTSAPAHLGSTLRQLSTKVMMRFLYPRATRLIAVSSGVASRLSSRFGVEAAKVDVIANPIDIPVVKSAARQSEGSQFDQPYVMAFGRLVKIKNYALLIRAFARSKLDCRLVIAGEGPERESLQSLACELEIADRVEFPGWLSNPYPALSRASAFALTSDVEGFPNALVEALVLGIPAIATNCEDGPAEILAGTSREKISELTIAEAGILTPAGDVTTCARALQLVFEQPIRERLIEGGRSRAEHYSAAAITDLYWDLIERELGRRSAARAI